MKKDKLLIDPSIEKFYAEGNEKDRLSTHRLEQDRTLQILRKRLPPPPAVILDVGGAAGIYAFPLTEMGYKIHLIDPVALHIRQAQEHAKKTGIHLASYAIGDARKIEQFAYLHRPEDLKREMVISGFENISLCSVEGPVWEKQVIEGLQKDEKGWQALLTLLEKIESEETIIGASAHIMAIGSVGLNKV